MQSLYALSLFEAVEIASMLAQNWQYPLDVGGTLYAGPVI